jgi:hypothetical protein
MPIRSGSSTVEKRTVIENLQPNSHVERIVQQRYHACCCPAAHVKFSAHI